jgi:hypothetical protein
VGLRGCCRVSRANRQCHIPASIFDIWTRRTAIICKHPHLPPVHLQRGSFLLPIETLQATTSPAGSLPWQASTPRIRRNRRRRRTADRLVSLPTSQCRNGQFRRRSSVRARRSSSLAANAAWSASRHWVKHRKCLPRTVARRAGGGLSRPKISSSLEGICRCQTTTATLLNARNP